jgi:V/A-type H+-transporting ATPase subunit K
MEMDSIWLYLSAALAVGIPAVATGWAQSRIGPAAAAALAEKPELTVTVVLLIAIPETVAILGFVISVLILMQGGG